MTPAHFDQVVVALDNDEVRLSTPQLARAVSFLLEARTTGKGWGPYPKVESDSYHSAVVIDALHRCAEDRCSGILADAVIHFQHEVSSSGQLKKLKPRQLAELLTIAAADRQPDSEHIRRLSRALAHAYDRQKVIENTSTRDLAWSLYALYDAGLGDETLAATLRDRLVILQRPDDGGWPGAAGQDAATVPTALAVAALSRVPSLDDVLERGAQYLATTRDDRVRNDPYIAGAVLRAIATVRPAHERVGAIVSHLMSTQHSDGGWSASPEGPSRVEDTAVCIVGLLAAGENLYVPKRLALTVATQLRDRLEISERERNELRDAFDKKVLEHCGKVADEKARLLEQQKGLKAQIKELQQRRDIDETVLEQVQYRLSTAPHRSVSPRNVRSLRMLILAVVVSAAAAAGGAAWTPTPRSAIVIAAIVTISASAALLLGLRRLPIEPLADDLLDVLSFEAREPELPALRAMFREITEAWPVEFREELLYRLVEFVDLPPDMAVRFVEDMAVRLRVPAHEMRRLIAWITFVARLSPTQRRRLFFQLQRSALT